jgi:outer membrane protein assembly factor BamB
MKSALILFGITVIAAGGTSDDIGEIRQFHANDPNSGDQFGWSIDATLTRTLTGAPYDDRGGSDTGAAYIHDATTGEQIHKLTADDDTSGALLGCSVALTGQRAVVGARQADAAGSNSGAVYVFGVQSGEQLHRLIPDDAAPGQLFGTSVDAIGSTIIAGAPRDAEGGFGSGAAYLFDAATGQQLHKLTASDAAPSDFFGGAVAIGDGLAAVGANDDGYDGLLSAGSVYIFDASTGTQLRKLTPSNPQANGNFGLSIAMSGDLIVVGSWNGMTGAAYLFDASTGEQLHQFASPAPSSADFFGLSVAISGRLITVGASGEVVNGVEQGAAYVFDAISGEELYRLVASDGAILDRLGTSVAVFGNRAFAGARFDNTYGFNAGAAYSFDVTPCFADINNDNTVDLTDLNIILGRFGLSTPIGDTNFDGVVDIADLNTLLSEFGTVCP